MNPISAGNAPALPDADRAYFESEEFFARWRNMADAMAHGAKPPEEDLPKLLGCSIRTFSAYLLSMADAHGISRIPIGKGEHVELPYAHFLSLSFPSDGEHAPPPEHKVLARGRNRKRALSVIIPRLRHWRDDVMRFAASEEPVHRHLQSLKREGRTPVYYVEVNDLILRFCEVPVGVYFSVTQGGINEYAMTGYLDYAGPLKVVDGVPVFDRAVPLEQSVRIMSWRRGWEDRLF